MKVRKVENSEIILQKLSGKWWEIDEDLRIIVKLDVGILLITLKKGFETDLGSIPKFAQSWIDRANDNIIPFLLHDFGYVYGGFGQETWDNLLYQCLRLKGMGWFKAKMVHKAVSWFGGSHFEDDPEQKHYCKFQWVHKRY
jgi:hypothetical protein